VSDDQLLADEIVATLDAAERDAERELAAAILRGLRHRHPSQ